MAIFHFVWGLSIPQDATKDESNNADNIKQDSIFHKLFEISFDIANNPRNTKETMNSENSEIEISTSWPSATFSSEQCFSRKSNILQNSIINFLLIEMFCVVLLLIFLEFLETRFIKDKSSK